MDSYTKRLRGTEKGRNLLDKHFVLFVDRIGAYIGEVIRQEVKEDFFWYNYNSVNKYLNKTESTEPELESETVLFSRKKGSIISPMPIVSDFLQGKPRFPSLLAYAEEIVNRNK